MSTEERRKEFLDVMIRMGKPRAIQRGFHGGELTPGEYFMLSVLRDHRARNPQCKGMYVSELAELLDVSSPAVSRMLGGMEQKEYVERVVDREDRRTTYIVLRPDGERTLGQMEDRAMTLVDRIVNRLGEEDAATLIKLWSRLADIMDEEQAKGI